MSWGRYSIGYTFFYTFRAAIWWSCIYYIYFHIFIYNIEYQIPYECWINTWYIFFHSCSKNCSGFRALILGFLVKIRPTKALLKIAPRYKSPTTKVPVAINQTRHHLQKSFPEKSKKIYIYDKKNRRVTKAKPNKSLSKAYNSRPISARFAASLTEMALGFFAVGQFALWKKKHLTEPNLTNRTYPYLILPNLT